MFVAEIVDAPVTSDKNPLTYADCHSKVKPKACSSGCVQYAAQKCGNGSMLGHNPGKCSNGGQIGH